MLPRRDKCQEKIQGTVGIGLTFMMPEVQMHFADKEQRFPLLKLEQLNDQQRPFADEVLKVSSIGISGPFNMMLRSPGGKTPLPIFLKTKGLHPWERTSN